MKTIIKMMEFSLWFTVIIYFFEGNHSLFNFLNINYWKGISLFRSSSFTESNICCEVFLQLFIFFNYFKDAEGIGINKKQLTICSKVAFVFTILSFKRLGVVMAFLMLLINKFIDLRGNVSSKLSWALASFFTMATFFYTKFMKGEIFPDFDIYNFTTGRDYILSLWKQYNYLSYGYGSSLILINRYLEMDLVQLYLELNLVVVYIFCAVFFHIAKSSIYSFVVMCYAFLNMLVASSLPASLPWVIMLVTIVCISSSKCRDEGVSINSKRSSVRKLFRKRDE